MASSSWTRTRKWLLSNWDKRSRLIHDLVAVVVGKGGLMILYL